jgi:hypothetical protein
VFRALVETIDHAEMFRVASQKRVLFIGIGASMSGDANVAEESAGGAKFGRR